MAFCGGANEFWIFLLPLPTPHAGHPALSRRPGDPASRSHFRVVIAHFEPERQMFLHAGAQEVQVLKSAPQPPSESEGDELLLASVATPVLATLPAGSKKPRISFDRLQSRGILE